MPSVGKPHNARARQVFLTLNAHRGASGPAHWFRSFFKPAHGRSAGSLLEWDRGRAPHVPGSADPGTKIAAVERREALPAQRQRRRHASPGCRAASPAAPGSSQAPTFFDAPLPSLGRDVWTTAYRVPVTNAGDGACPFHPPARGQGIRKKQGCPLPLRHRMIGLDLPFQPTTPKNKRSTETRL